MPLYEYLCESCGERTEILQRFGDLTEVVCPACGAPMRKLPSAPSIQFKGSGFYLTDYARKSGGTEGALPRSESDKGGEKSGEKSGDAGSSVSSAGSAGSAASAGGAGGAGSGASAAGAGSDTGSSAPASAPPKSVAAAPAKGSGKPSAGSRGE